MDSRPAHRGDSGEGHGADTAWQDPPISSGGDTPCSTRAHPYPRSSELSFPTDPTGLPEATSPEVLDLADGGTLNLRVAPVAKDLDGSTVRMLGYNGSIPGPTLRVRQGSEVIVNVTNDGDLDTTVHWHGLRLDNKYDGVPHETQLPIPVGGSFTYRIRFPDPGLYWYHPHIREDYTQEMGLYGNILVEPAEPDYWPPAHRDLVLTLDDVLLEDGKIASFSVSETSYAAMGRFGNLLLIGGQTDLAADGASRRGAPAVVDQHRQHPGLQRPAARRPDEARRRGQRPGGARGVRLRGPAGAVRARGRRRPARPARAADPGTPHPEPHLPAGVDHRDRGAGGAVAGRPVPASWPAHRSWPRSVSSSTPGWPRRRTRSSRWSPRWTTPPPPRPVRGPRSTPARCTPRSPATSRAAAPSAG